MEAEKHTANNLLTEYKTEDSSAERERKKAITLRLQN